MNLGAEAYFDLTSLRHNLQQARKFSPTSKILAMIKSNGYGHGLVEVASALAAADGFGVASLEEAMFLREAGIKQPIVVMLGFSSSAELQEMVRLDLGTVIHCPEQLELLERAKLAKTPKIWLKFDTGMHRLGFPVEDIGEIYNRFVGAQRAASVPAPLQEPCIMSHLATADEEGNPATTAQLRLFADYCDNLIAPKSIANSAAVLVWPHSHYQWIRPGLMLYGVSPFVAKTAAEFNLKPVMTLKSRLVAVKNVKKGERVGYGGNWQCQRDTKIGIAAIGYGDGYSRYLPNGTPILVAGKQCELVGRVSMDMISIDLTNSPTAGVGSDVVLWGKDLPVETVANWANTIPYVLLCGITGRVRRIYCDG